MNEPVKYAAQVRGVRELSLRGSADLHYWQTRLKPHGLEPLEEDGRARILVIGGNLRFAGLPFREISLSVELERDPDSHFPNAACLLQAFNTNRFFAFSERLFFSTPYHHARCEVSLERPRRLRVESFGTDVLAAEMNSSPERAPTHDGPGGQLGPVFVLPGPGASALRYFIAKIEGHTETFPFDCDTDTLEINPAGPGADALDHLRASGFDPLSWIVRKDTLHAKSPTRHATVNGQ